MDKQDLSTEIIIQYGNIIQNQLQKHSVDVWSEVEDYIGKEFHIFSESTNNMLLKEYFLTLANECHEHAFKLKRVSKMIHKDDLNHTLSIVNPLNILKKYREDLRRESEFINYVKFYSWIIGQLGINYSEFLRKTNNIEISTIFKKICDDKRFQEDFLLSLIY